MICSYAVATDDVFQIFETCRLEHGVYGRRRQRVNDDRTVDDDVFDDDDTGGVTNDDDGSPWCAVLTPQMIDVLEYHQDIKYYYEDGYGHLISYAPACVIIRDLLHHLV